MIDVRFDQLATILCLGAHADDIEIGCGGTLLKLLADYPVRSVHWVVLSADELRAGEARQSAAAFVGGEAELDVRIEAFRDRFFPFEGAAIKEFFARLQSEIAPDLIFTHRRNDVHQDHRTVAELTWNAFRDHVIFEYEIPKYEGDLGSPNMFVPLSEPIVCGKIQRLLNAFPSQHSRSWFTEDTFRALARLRGVECNARSGYAEAFRCRKLTL